MLYVYMQLLCMYGLGYSYAWIVGQNFLLKSLYENLGHHGASGCYDANLLAKIEQEI